MRPTSASRSPVSTEALETAGFAFDAQPDDRLWRLRARVKREHAARTEAEHLLESKSLELFAMNRRLVDVNSELERRVEARTYDLANARNAAVRLAETDTLTEIRNRLKYIRALDDALRSCSASQRAVGLLLIDVDKFKFINDSFGHAYGDGMLKSVAERLVSAAWPGEVVFRIGGDEFAILIPGSDSASVKLSCLRYLQAFDQPVTVRGITLTCTASAGLAISPQDTTSITDLQRFADLALYQVKSAGGDGLKTFRPALLHAFEFRHRIEQDFREAVANNSVDVWYQPIFSLEDGSVLAVEALARWTDSSGSPVAPDYFIPLAESCGLIRTLGGQLLRKTLKKAAKWLSQRHIDYVAFNVSPLELLDPGFADDVIAALVETNIPPAALLLEITEGVAVKRFNHVKNVLTQLATHGVKFALDDFGSGYSNISYLRQLPLSTIKLDRSLLAEVADETKACIILQNMARLGSDLGMKTVCEGAETVGQLDFLGSIGCHAVQGFACARPAPGTDIDNFFAGRDDILQ